MSQITVRRAVPVVLIILYIYIHSLNELILVQYQQIVYISNITERTLSKMNLAKNLASLSLNKPATIDESSTIEDIKSAINLAKANKDTKKVLQLLKLQKKVKKKIAASSTTSSKTTENNQICCQVCQKPVYPTPTEDSNETKTKPTLKTSSVHDERDLKLPIELNAWLEQHNQKNQETKSYTITSNTDLNQKQIHLTFTPFPSNETTQVNTAPIQVTVHFLQSMLSAETENERLNATANLMEYCFSVVESRTLTQILTYISQKITKLLIAEAATTKQSEQQQNDSDNSEYSYSDNAKSGSDSDDSNASYEYSDDEHDLEEYETKSKLKKDSHDTIVNKIMYGGGDKRKTLRQTSYESGDTQVVSDTRQTILSKFSTLTNLSLSRAAILLRHVRWNLDEACAKWSTDAASFKQVAGVSETTSTNGYDLGCGHEFCKECWTIYLTQNLYAVPSTAMEAICMSPTCNIIADRNMYQRYLNANQMELYNRVVIESFVDEQSAVRWCPMPDCGQAILYSERQLTVRCGNNHVFCFRCSEKPHAPCGCKESQAFLEKRTEKHSPSGKLASKLAESIKPCPNPNCKIPTEKISGCMYLLCAKCKCNWCWQCGDYGSGRTERPPPHHVYDCNNSKNQEWVQTTDNLFDNDGRFTWHMERYDNHMDSMRIAKIQRTEISLKAENVEREGRAVSMEFMKTAVQLIVECRLLLAWSYGCAFFIDDEGARAMFDFQQNYLETTTEKLHGQIEEMVKVSVDGGMKNKPIGQDEKMSIVNLTASLHKYKEALESLAPQKEMEVEMNKLKQRETLEAVTKGERK